MQNSPLTAPEYFFFTLIIHRFVLNSIIMKQQILLFSITLVIANFCYSQVEITKVGNPALVNGTQLVHVVNTSGDSNIDLLFKNTSTTDKYWKITRKQLTTLPVGWTDYICWGIEGGAGQCYTSSTQNPWITPDGLTVYDAQFNPVSGLPAGEAGLAAIHFVNPICGTADYRYYVHEDGGQYLDSVDVKVVFSCASIDDKETISFSVYPNPVSSQLTINTEGMEKLDIRIFDVLGKIVYDEKAIKSKKIDMSELKNGVYILTFIEKGITIQTKRVIVRH